MFSGRIGPLNQLAHIDNVTFLDVTLCHVVLIHDFKILSRALGFKHWTHFSMLPLLNLLRAVLKCADRDPKEISARIQKD